ncbi:hypothetical protein [Salinimicrobium gaetbulicola]|uniref:Uncharacterized protein n=1 Tax=Salinimicrobium gaetbulicola TaxID=999702 RepID=A0ABW3ID78_9FLAO
MEFEEMKSLWTDMSQKVEKQQLLTDKLIIKMTEERYTNKFRKIYGLESLGAVTCLAGAFYILLNIQKLDTWYLLTCGIICLVLLLVLPMITLRSINRTKSLNISQRNVKETLVKFYRAKNELLFTQRLNMYLGILFALVILPVFSKIMNGKDLFIEENINDLWLFIPILLAFLFVMAAWVFRAYKNITTSAENILKELDT